MKKPIYKVVRYRNTNKCVYGENKKIANKKNNFVVQLVKNNDDDDQTIVPQPIPTGTNAMEYQSQLIFEKPSEPFETVLRVVVYPPEASQELHFELPTPVNGVSLATNGIILMTPDITVSNFIIDVYPKGYPELKESMGVIITNLD